MAVFAKTDVLSAFPNNKQVNGYVNNTSVVGHSPFTLGTSIYYRRDVDNIFLLSSSMHH